MLKVGIADILGIANIADIVDIVDIGTDIADIGMDIADIATGIMDVVNSADIADWMLRTLRWKQVDAYKVSWGYPITKSLYISIASYMRSTTIFFSIFPSVFLRATGQ